MSIRIVLPLLLCTLFISGNAVAEIDPGAPSASHRLQLAAENIHAYLHHNYQAGYGTHELEEAAAAMHDALHEWDHGELTEADIVAIQEDLKASWLNYIQTITPAGILNNGDMELETLYQDVKTKYKELRFLLRKADGR
jgi:hypothetical protein